MWATCGRDMRDASAALDLQDSTSGKIVKNNLVWGRALVCVCVLLDDLLPCPCSDFVESKINTFMCVCVGGGGSSRGALQMCRRRSASTSTISSRSLAIGHGRDPSAMTAVAIWRPVGAPTKCWPHAIPTSSEVGPRSPNRVRTVALGPDVLPNFG